MVIPCYNGAKYLRPCLESVRAQRYAGPVEVLVGDDGSCDGSARVVESFSPAVKVLIHPGRANRGVAATRNLCLRAATQPLIAFLDSDDLWLPGHLTALAGALAARPDAGLAYDNGRYATDDGSPFGARLPVGHREATAETLLADCFLTVNSVMMRQSVLARVGLFDEGLDYGEDHDLWLRVLEQTAAVYVPVFGYVYRQHAGQATNRLERMWIEARRVLRKARERHPYPRSAVRSREAVIAYRLGMCAVSSGRYGRGMALLAKAALLDPVRAGTECLRKMESRLAMPGRSLLRRKRLCEASPNEA